MAWVALGVAAVGVVGKVISGNEQASAAKKAQQNAEALDKQYQPSQYSKDTLATAQQAYGGRMTGAETLDRNIDANTANTTASNVRGATSGAQFLAAQAASEGQNNQAHQNEQLQEGQNKYGLLNNLNLARMQMTGEGDKGYLSQQNQFQNQQNQANQLRQSSLSNYFGALNDTTSLVSLGVTAANKGKTGVDPYGNANNGQNTTPS